MAPSRAYRYFKTMKRPSASRSRPKCACHRAGQQRLASAQQSFTRAIKKHRDNVCHSALCIHLSTNSIEQSISESETQVSFDVNCHPPFDVLVLVLVSICHFYCLQWFRIFSIQFDFAIPYSRPRTRASFSDKFTVLLRTSKRLTELPVTVVSICAKFRASPLIISL